MNVYLLIESLSETEKKELKSYFLKQENAKAIEETVKISLLTPIQSFINNHPEFSVRIINILLTQKYPSEEYYFPYANDITKRGFLTMRNAGIKSWRRVYESLKKDGIAQ